MEIVRRRLFNLADDAFIRYVASKAAKTGDVRTLIEMASRCVNALDDKYCNDKLFLSKKLEDPIITSIFGLQALKSMQGDPDIESLQKTSAKGLQVLISLVLASTSVPMSMTDMINSYNTFLAEKSLPGVSGDEFRFSFDELCNNGFLTAENVTGFGGRFSRTNQQGKSQQTKYNLKIVPMKLIKVLKAKDMHLGVIDLENMIKQSQNNDDL
jgi:hypothetical protein